MISLSLLELMTPSMAHWLLQAVWQTLLQRDCFILESSAISDNYTAFSSTPLAAEPHVIRPLVSKVCECLK